MTIASSIYSTLQKPARTLAANPLNARKWIVQKTQEQILRFLPSLLCALLALSFGRTAWSAPAFPSTGVTLALASGQQSQEADESTSGGYVDIPYGPHKKNVLDFWKAQSDKPTPVIIYMHGGGFVGGDKEKIPEEFIRACLMRNISVASANYRLVTDAPFPAPQHDAARAVQFLRYKARDWNIDTSRMAAFGESAGGGLALWVAFHDDLRKRRSRDPVERYSSRLTCAAAFGAQTTYDPHVIEEWIGGNAHLHPSLLLCYDVISFDALDDPKLQPLFDEVSPIQQLSKDDPPVFMCYFEPDKKVPDNAEPGEGIHHPIFGRKLKAAMDRLGIRSEYHHRSDLDKNPLEAMLLFFIDCFKAKQ